MQKLSIALIGMITFSCNSCIRLQRSNTQVESSSSARLQRSEIFLINFSRKLEGVRGAMPEDLQRISFLYRKSLSAYSQKFGQDFVADLSDEEFERASIEKAERRKSLIQSLPSLEQFQMVSLSQTSSAFVRKILLGSGPAVFFRDLEVKYTPVLETLAAYTLNALLQLKSVPFTQAGRFECIEGNVRRKCIGSLSVEAQGNTLGAEFDSDPAQTLARYAESESFKDLIRDSYAFEFLIGNDDVHSQNIYILQGSTLAVVDHDRAFPLDFDASFRWFGAFPPTSVSKQLFSKLKELDSQTISKSLLPYLSQRQIDLVLFRLEVLLNGISEENRHTWKNLTVP